METEEPVFFYGDGWDNEGRPVPVTFRNVTMMGKPIKAVKVPASELCLPTGDDDDS